MSAINTRVSLLLQWALLACAAPHLAGAQQLIHEERSLYRQVLVYEEPDSRCLCFTRECSIGRQSCIDLRQPQRLVFDYTRMMLGALFLDPEPNNVLIIGLGGGTLPHSLRQLLPNADIDVVEIDPAVVRVAEQYFGFHADERMPVFEEDGRAYVRRVLRSERRYQLIMLDAYDSQYIPEHMLTREFLSQVRALLAPGGIVAANTFSASRLYDSESVTYRSVFGQFYNLRSVNRVILASNAELPSLAQAAQNSQRFVATFKPLGFTPQSVLSRFSTSSDWNAGARVLTDQYSPANLLNSTAR